LQTRYVNKPGDIKIVESNLAEITSREIILNKNSSVISLVENEDYKVERIVAEGEYQYTYTLFASNFSDEGTYVINVNSTDATGNCADARLLGMETELVVDKTGPEITVSDLSEDEIYSKSEHVFNISALDDAGVNDIKVYINGEEKQIDTAEYFEGLSEFIPVSIDESDGELNIKIVASDSIGNVSEKNYNNILISSNASNDDDIDTDEMVVGDSVFKMTTSAMSENLIVFVLIIAGATMITGSVYTSINKIKKG